MVFYTLVSQFYLKNWKKEKKKMRHSKEKNRKKIKQSYHGMISVDGKGTVFPVKLKLQGTSLYLNKYIERRFLKKN